MNKTKMKIVAIGLFFADWNFYSDSIAVGGCRDNG